MLRLIVAVIVGSALLLASAEWAGHAVNRAIVTLEPANSPARWTVEFTP